MFKGETRSAISESNQGLGDITKTTKELLSTIRISSKQVQHSTDNDSSGSLYDVTAEGEEVLSDIISQQEQRAFLQEDNAKRFEERIKAVFGAETGPDPLDGRS